jgi:hypothetical protein
MMTSVYLIFDYYVLIAIVSNPLLLVEISEDVRVRVTNAPHVVGL